MLKPFKSINVSPPKVPFVKRRYSVTADVVDFRRCARQYGAFRVHNYAPAYQTQLYFGTIIHQVLDRCHSHYHGTINPTTKGLLPDNGRVLTTDEIQTYFDQVRKAQIAGTVEPLPPTEIISYFLEVENGLKSRNIRAVTHDLRLKAIRILQYFNALEGPVLYPRVLDTEHRLQADRNSHILHGVVDLLVDSPAKNKNPAQGEIWDYKGTSHVNLTPENLKTYLFQMRVYALLYEVKHGVRPRRAVLYFLNELEGRTCPTIRPVNALLEVPLDPASIDEAMKEFTATVHKIEQARDLDEWKPAIYGQIDEVNDCAICDLRWDCPTPLGGKGVSIRYP